MMKHDILRKIALVIAIVMVLTCFAACKSTGGKEESAVVDEYIEGDTQKPSGDSPTIVPNDNNNNSGENNQPNNNQGGNDDQTNDDQTNDDQTNDDQTNDDQTNDDQTNDDQTNDDQTNDDQTNDDQDDGGEVVKPPFSMDKALKIVSYNIKCAWYGKTINQVAEQLKEIDGDIVGLQEVDCNTGRSTGGNQVETLAQLTGYPYYYFAPVIQLGADKTQPADADLKTNAYGHAILSKYPIKKSEIIWPTAQSETGECRNFERHEIDVNGKTVAFYNTHADFSLGRKQYFEVQEKYMAKDKYAICVGDFNETMDEMNVYFDPEKFYGFAFGEDMKTPFLRDKNGEKSQVIDHIIVTKDTMTWYDTEVQNGYYVRPHEGGSDHNMIYAYVNLLD